jgi:L-lactate utilization protein LutB
MRVLARELGQDFNIDQALADDNGWKGRQQKIERLKARVKDLEERLTTNGVNVSHITSASQATKPAPPLTTTRSSALLA